MHGMTDMHKDEKELLLAYLAQQRGFIRLATYGITDEQGTLTPSASSLSLGGLVKHVAKVEDHWIDLVVGRQREEDPEAYDQGFTLGPGETLGGMLARYDAVAQETERRLAGVSIDHPVPVPRGVPWYPADLDAWDLRWVLLHLVEETARHAGHADIIRESIDGATWFPLLSAAENWDLRPFVEPWEPPVPASAS